MSYRGDDLDLRTPQARGGRESYASDSGLNGARSRMTINTTRADALYVDDTVLACCNHAYDVALAHGASEVRLEHLVHALTRVEAAAEILEGRGIREAHLRRESAAVIASEIPVGLAHGHAAPRASVEFEDVLRRASDQARARGTAATVHDLLWVLLNYSREFPAISLLLRHASNWQQWDWPQDMSQDMRRESMTRTVAYAEPRRTATYVETPPPPPPQRTRVVERADVAMPQQVVYAQAQPDEGIYARLDQMDGALRKLQADIATDRRGFVDLIREVQRELVAGRNSSPQLPVGFVERVETALDKRLDDVTRTAGQLAERLQTLERSVSAGMQDGAKNWAALSDRLKVVDKLAATNPNTGLADLVTEQLVQISDRVQTLEHTLETRQAESQRAWSSVAERLRAIDETIVAGRQQTAELRTSFTTDIRGMIDRALTGQSQATGVIQSLVSDRFNAINQQFDQQALTLTSAVAQLTEPTIARITQIDTANTQRQGEQVQMLRLLSERSNALEALVKSTGEQASADKTELHEGVIALATKQQTLAENLEQWRAEAEGGLSIVSNRLELLERGSAAPMQALKQMQADLANLQQVTLADYDQNRKGIRNWLFGTEEIFSGSWRDETAQIRARLKQLREERKA